MIRFGVAVMPHIYKLPTVIWPHNFCNNMMVTPWSHSGSGKVVGPPKNPLLPVKTKYDSHISEYRRYWLCLARDLFLQIRRSRTSELVLLFDYLPPLEEVFSVNNWLHLLRGTCHHSCFCLLQQVSRGPGLHSCMSMIRCSITLSVINYLFNALLIYCKL